MNEEGCEDGWGGTCKNVWGGRRDGVGGRRFLIRVARSFVGYGGCGKR